MKTLLVGLLVLSGCVARAGYGVRASARVPVVVGSAPGGPPPPPSSEPVPAYGPDEDQHWFAADDYLVTKEAFRGRPIHYLHVAKLMEAPAGATKGEGRFLTARGDDLWTASFWRTRLPASSELVVGALAFCHQPSAYRSSETTGPRDKRDARNEGWLIAPITDTSDAFKGRIAVGPLSCPIAAVRVPMR